MAVIFFVALILFYCSSSNVEFQLGRSSKPTFQKGELLWITKERLLGKDTHGGELPCRFVRYDNAKNAIVVRIPFYRRFGTHPSHQHAIRKDNGYYCLRSN